MRRTISTLHYLSLTSGALFAWAIAAEMEFLPRLADLFWLRWQVCVLAGVVSFVSADRLSEWHCRCCGASDVLLRALMTRSHELLCRRCLHWNPGRELPVPPVSSVSSARIQ